MFKSKLFQYCAIAATVVVTSGVIVSSTASLQSQSQPKTEAKAQLDLKSGLSPDKLTQLPDFGDKVAESSNLSDIPSGRFLKQLNLTPEQLQKLKTIRELNLPQMRELSQKLRQTNKELRDLLAGNESSDAIRTKHTQMLGLQQELQKQHFERMLSMREILTPQQRSQLNEIMQKNRTRMREGIRDRMQNRMEERKEKLDNLRDRSTL